jgi:hypothetical protein
MTVDEETERRVAAAIDKAGEDACDGKDTIAELPKHEDLMMNLARAAIAAMPEPWRTIESIPQDRPIEAWHKTWKCPVSIAYRSWGDRAAWVEKTLTTEWPIEAFTHWREMPAPPETDR